MTTPSNERIGRLFGVSHATISRYRSGDRFPELDTLGKIAEILDWSLDEQFKARQEGTWSDEFSRRVADGDSLGAVGQEAATH